MRKKYLKYFVAFVLFVVFPGRSETITWACVDYPEAHYVKNPGEVSGYLYDIVSEVFEKELNHKLKIDFYPWKRCQRLVEEGKYDMIFTIPTEERLNYCVTHKTPAWVKKRVVYTYVGNPKIAKINKIASLEDLRSSGLVLITYIGNGWLKSKISKQDGYLVEYSTKIDNVWNMLAHKRGDVIIEEQSLADANFKRFGLTDKIIKTKGIGSESNFHILISNKSKYINLLPMIENSLQKLHKEGRIKKILDKYNQK